MPLKKTSYAKKRVYRRRPAMRRRVTTKKSNNLPEWSSGSFTRPLVNPANSSSIFNVNTMYRLYDIGISQFPRATLLAAAHQQYRITKVSMRFKPLVDTFIGGGAETVPNLYYMIDKAQSLSPNVGIPALKSAGCTPKRLDDKLIMTRWSPGVIENVNTTTAGGGAFAKVQTSPWLNTTDDPFASPVAISTVDHKGITWGVEQVVGQSGNYMIDLTIEVQFRKAAFEPPESATSPALNAL